MRPSLYQAPGMLPWTSSVCPSQLRGGFLQGALPGPQDGAEGRPVASRRPSRFPHRSLGGAASRGRFVCVAQAPRCRGHACFHCWTQSPAQGPVPRGSGRAGPARDGMRAVTPPCAAACRGPFSALGRRSLAKPRCPYALVTNGETESLHSSPLPSLAEATLPVGAGCEPHFPRKQGSECANAGMNDSPAFQKLPNS